jgi:hypothetical protein
MGRQAQYEKENETGHRPSDRALRQFTVRLGAVALAEIGLEINLRKYLVGHLCPNQGRDFLTFDRLFVGRS